MIQPSSLAPPHVRACATRAHATIGCNCHCLFIGKGNKPIEKDSETKIHLQGNNTPFSILSLSLYSSPSHFPSIELLITRAPFCLQPLHSDCRSHPVLLIPAEISACLHPSVMRLAPFLLCRGCPRCRIPARWQMRSACSAFQHPLSNRVRARVVTPSEEGHPDSWCWQWRSNVLHANNCFWWDEDVVCTAHGHF